MKAMILAAGYGSRLGALTRDTPKPLLEIKGRPLIVHAIRTLADAGIRNIIVNLHHHGEMIRSTLGDGSAFGVKIEYIEEPVLLGTGGGLRYAEFFFDREPFVLMNSDIFTDITLADVFEFHRGRNADATMVLKKPLANEIAAVTIDPDGRVIDLRKKRGLGDESNRRLFTGIQILEPVAFDYLRQSKEKSPDIIDAFYQPALDDGLSVLGFEFGGFWMDVGTPENLRRASEL